MFKNLCYIIYNCIYLADIVIFRGENMVKKYGKKRHKQHYVFYTVITTILLCTVFLSMVASLSSSEILGERIYNTS